MSTNDKNWKNRLHSEEIFEFFAAVREGIQKPVAELREGDQMITRWDRIGHIVKTVPVKDRKSCDGGNGMHVHINGNQCYDSRSLIWVAE